MQFFYIGEEREIQGSLLLTTTIVLFYCDNRFMSSSKTDNISHDLYVFPMYFLIIQKYIKYHKAYNLIQVQISAEYYKD